MKDQYCSNCHHPVKEANKYCGNCGQKKIEGRIRIFDFLKDLFANIFNWDAKIWITPIMLFRPGFLSQKFFEGKRQRYTNPGKLLLFTLVVYFAIFLFYMGDGFRDLDKGGQTKEKAFAYSFLDEEKDSLQIFLENKYTDVNIEGISDSVVTFLRSDMNGYVSIGFLDLESISQYDLMFLSEEELFEKYEANDLSSQIIIKGIKRIVQSPGGYIKYVVGRSSWIILGSIPFLAFILMLLYIRHKRYYVEHVVFLIHLNSFVFLLGIIFFLLGYIFGVNDMLILLPYLLGMLYAFPAMKIFYGQGYIKTFIKYSVMVMGSFYIFIFLTFLMFALGMLLF